MKEPDHWSRCIHEIFLNAYERAKKSSGMTREMPVVLMFVVDAKEIDVYCEKVEDLVYKITLNSGLFQSLNRLFRAILANPLTFPSIGNFLLESPGKEKRSISFGKLVEEIQEGENRIPNDETRLGFADHLTELAIRFVVEHELAHILAGHLDYKPMCSEILGFADKVGIAEQASFGLEMHADELAFTNCLIWITDTLQGKEHALPKRIFIETVDAQIHDLYTATYTFFQLVSHLSMSKTHPNPVHRQIRLGMILTWFCKTFEVELKLRNKPYELVSQVLFVIDSYMKTVFAVDWSDRQQDAEYILTNQMDSEIKPYSEMVSSLYPTL